MFNLFGGKKGDTLTTIKSDANELRTQIHRIQKEFSTVLESKGRATKDERTSIVTTSLEAFNKIDSFLYQVDKRT
jgi:hypothetical protein